MVVSHGANKKQYLIVANIGRVDDQIVLNILDE